MRKTSRVCVLLLSVLMGVFALAGCTDQASNTPDGSGTTVTTDPTASTDTQKTETSKPAEPEKLTMFFGDGGIGFPDGVIPDDNEFINIFESAANIDVEMVVPAYQDFSTKFNLMMSSGDIPDLVHAYNKNEMNRYGKEGAFKDWLPLLEQSAKLGALYDDQMREMMKQEDGAIYALQTLSNQTVEGTGIRIDLVNEVNDGHIPTTPDEMQQFFKNIIAKYPDSVPISPNNGKTFYRASGLFESFGVHPWGLQRDTAESTDYYWFLEHRNAKQAVEYYKQLYDEGLLYKEFPTVGGDIYNTLMKTKKIAYYDADVGNIISARFGVCLQVIG